MDQGDAVHSATSNDAGNAAPHLILDSVSRALKVLSIVWVAPVKTPSKGIQKPSVTHDDRFRFQKLAQSVNPPLAAHSGLLETAERGEGIMRQSVDEDPACLKLSSDSVSSVGTGSAHVSHQ